MAITMAAARINAGYTQEQVAKEMKVTSNTIVNWELGKTSPTIRNWKRLCDLYGLPIDGILLPDETNLIGPEGESECQE